MVETQGIGIALTRKLFHFLFSFFVISLAVSPFSLWMTIKESGNPVSWPNLLVVLLLGISMLISFASNRENISITGLLIVLWFFYSVLVLIVVGKASIHMGEIFALFRVVAIFYALRTLFRLNGVKAFISSTIILAAIFTCLAYLQEIGFLIFGEATLGLSYSSIKVTEDVMGSMFGVSYVRAHFLVGDPNYFALYILPGLGLLLYKCINKPNPARILFTVFIFSGVLLTFSRGALLSFMVCSFVLFMKTKISVAKKAASLFVGALFLVFIIANMSRGENTSSSSGERAHLIKEAFVKSGSNPFGYGIGEMVLDSPDSANKMTAHNTFLEILLFSGIPGLAVYLFILLNSFKHIRLNRNLYMSFLTVFIAGIFLSCTIYMVYWIYILAPIAYCDSPEVKKNLAT